MGNAKKMGCEWSSQKSPEREKLLDRFKWASQRKQKARTSRRVKINLYSKHIRRHQTISSKAPPVNTNDKKRERAKEGKDNKQQLCQHWIFDEGSCTIKKTLINTWKKITAELWSVSLNSKIKIMVFISIEFLDSKEKTNLTWTALVRLQIIWNRFKVTTTIVKIKLKMLTNLILNDLRSFK